MRCCTFLCKGGWALATCWCTIDVCWRRSWIFISCFFYEAVLKLKGSTCFQREGFESILPKGMSRLAMCTSRGVGNECFPIGRKGAQRKRVFFSFRHGEKGWKFQVWVLFLWFLCQPLCSLLPSAVVVLEWVLGCFGYLNTETNRVFGALGQNHHYFFFRIF